MYQFHYFDNHQMKEREREGEKGILKILRNIFSLEDEFAASTNGVTRHHQKHRFVRILHFMCIIFIHSQSHSNN